MGTDDLHRSLCLKLGWQEKFKPPQKDWKWVVLSKKPIKEVEGETFSGLGSKV